MNKNPMICDLTTGVCGEAAGDGVMEIIDFSKPQKTVNVYYVTDPICSHCWALEPVLRRFEEQYGQYFNFHTVMGGLLESWEGFADVKNGIGNPADVAGHWKEVGEHSRMPIDGTLWLDNPVQSSYPPSRVFKIIQQNSEELAVAFLRRAREAVFAFNRNIGEEEVLIDIVNQIGLDGESIVKEAGLSRGEQLLQEDFSLARSLGVRGFPTIIMVNAENKGVKIVGAQALENYTQGLKQVLETETEALQPKPAPTISEVMEKEKLLFSKEIEVMYDLEMYEVDSFVREGLPSGSYTIKELFGEKYIEKNK